MDNANPGWFDGFETHRLPGSEPGIELAVRVGGRVGAPPVLLLHGYPQTQALWHRVAQRLAPHCRLVLADLRGYGGSTLPAPQPDHAAMSKRALAADLVAVMHQLGHDRFAVAGHDRGGRVAHRLALDHPQVLTRLAVLDIAPTLDMYAATDMAFASAYYHWFFLIQRHPLPETLIGAAPVAYLHATLGGWGAAGLAHIEPAALAEYEHCFARPAAIAAACEDYRASAGIDLAHDRADRAAGRRIGCPLLVLWGAQGVVQRLFDPLALWQAQCAPPVQGRALDCGHFLPEEQPETTAEALHAFFTG